MSEQSVTISDDTRIPISMFRWIIGGIIAIAISGAGVARWAYSIDSGLDLVNHKLDEANSRMSSLVVEIKNMNDTGWTRNDMRVWVENLMERNPTISIPKIKDSR